MKAIEKKIRSGWTVEDCLDRFDCSSKEELFKLMRRNYSRKTVNGYIKRLEKNSIIQGEKNNQIKLDIEIHDMEKNTNQIKQSDVLTKKGPEATSIQTEKIKAKKGVIQKVVEFFKKLIK